MANQENKEVILSVRHLKQYFRFEKGALKYVKAVHDVSFDVYKGEVLGLVGESGCGKTTTGRSIIRLYDITSGSVYFKNIRIAAGTRWNEKEIKFKTKKANAKIKELKAELKNEIETLKNNSEDQVAFDIARKEAEERYQKEIDIINEELDAIVKRERDNIKRARYDNKHFNKSFAKEKVKEVKEKYSQIFKAEKDSGEKKNFAQKTLLYKNYLEELNRARKFNVMTDIQMIFQDPIASLDPRMTVKEIIAEGLRIRGIKNHKEIEERVNEALKEVGLLPEHASRYPHEFSGGQRQRIGIARALVMNPELIIADEPISALDVSIQAQVINLLNDLRQKRNLSILFIAHDLSVVKYFCDRIAVMYFGNLIELSTSEELFKHPLHPYTKSLLSAIPLPDPHYEKNRTRFDYVPSRDHDYSVDKPTLREVFPGHFVSCNEEEFNRYQQELKEDGQGSSRKETE